MAEACHVNSLIQTEAASRIRTGESARALSLSTSKPEVSGCSVSNFLRQHSREYSRCVDVDRSIGGALLAGDNRGGRTFRCDKVSVPCEKPIERTRLIRGGDSVAVWADLIRGFR